MSKTIQEYLADEGYDASGDAEAISDAEREAKRKDQQLRAERQLLNELKQQKIDELLEASLLGEKYRNARFENTETGHCPSFDHAVKRCTAYCAASKEVKKRGLGIYFYGASGTGKTRLMACMANALIEKHYSVLITSFLEIMKEIKTTFDNNAEKTEQGIINAITKVDFLFIDDLGTEKVSAKGEDNYMQEKVYDVINRRYVSALPTIFTSNYSIPDLIKQCGLMHKTVDRIAEMANVVLKIEGSSFRIKPVDNLPF